MCLDLQTYLKHSISFNTQACDQTWTMEVMLKRQEYNQALRFFVTEAAFVSCIVRRQVVLPLLSSSLVAVLVLELENESWLIVAPELNNAVIDRLAWMLDSLIHAALVLYVVVILTC